MVRFSNDGQSIIALSAGDDEHIISVKTIDHKVIFFYEISIDLNNPFPGKNILLGANNLAYITANSE